MSSIYQINVDFWMAERTVASVAVNNALFTLFGWNLVDKLDAPVLIHIALGICEAHIAIVVLVEYLMLLKQNRN